MTSEQQLQHAIDQLPKDHPPMPYKVAMKDRKGKLITHRYVRASSERRAELTAIKANKFIFRCKKTVKASAHPDGWTNECLSNYAPQISRETKSKEAIV
jgi:hypothetical protein